MISTIKQSSYTIGLFATLSLGYKVSSNLANVEDHTCCATLSAISGVQVHYPSNPSYVNRTESYWSVSAQLNPDCIVQPSSTSHVAAIVKALALQDGACKTTNFAVRSGGHTTWAGSNNINKGITIDLGLMNSTTFNPETKIASIKPGARWNSVYTVLDPLGFTVAGGRAGSVGVAGFLTGGGNSFYTAERGFACDNVVNFEIVTANGDVINANSQENSDLFLVLKGGSGANFGIVTRFDMQAFSATDLWGGTMSYPASVSQQHIKAYHAWTNDIQNYPEGSSIIFWSYLPDAQDIVILAAYEDIAGKVAPKGFEKFLAIPNSTSTMRLASHKALTDELEQPAGYRDCWFTMTFKNEIPIYQKIIELHEAFVNEWKTFTTNPDFITQCMFQSIPTISSQHSLAKGGNVLGLDKEPDNAVMLLFNIAVKSAEDEKVARQKLKEYGLKMRDFAQSVNGLVEWTYLNYADEWQDPLKSYGAENVAKIRAASRKFDPTGFFQTRTPGGFKISRVAEKSFQKEL